MTQPYKKNCLFCTQEITMSDETGKWLPYNKDGSSHDCRTNGNVKDKQEKKEAPAKSNKSYLSQQEQEKPITIKQLKIWLARLEKNGIHIDIESILNPKKDEK